MPVAQVIAKRLQDLYDALRGTRASLPGTANTGDVYLATDTGEEFYYDGSLWIPAGGVPHAYKRATLLAHKTTSFSPSANSWTTLTSWSSSVLDLGSNFNTSTGLYTCPLTGVYRLSYKLKLAEGMSTNTNFGGSISKSSGADLGETDNVAWTNHVANPNGNSRISLQDSYLAVYNAGDTIGLRCFINNTSSPQIQVARMNIQYIHPST